MYMRVLKAIKTKYKQEKREQVNNAGCMTTADVKGLQCHAMCV